MKPRGFEEFSNFGRLVVPPNEDPIMTDSPAPGPGALAGSRAYEPRTPWSPVAGAMASVIIVMAAVLGYAAGIAIAVWGLNLAAQGLPQPDGYPPELIAAGVVALLAAQPAAVATTIFFAGRRGGRAADVLAWVKPQGGRIAYLVAPVVFCVGAAALGIILSLVWPHDPMADLRLYLPIVHSPYWWLLILVAVIGAPASEELLFRGFLFSCLARTRLGLAGTAVVTSALWSLLHVGYSIQGVVLVFSLGLLLSAILVRTGSLRVTMLCHAVYNGACMAFLMLTTAV